MRKASSWKEMAALEKCSEETYQFQELYVLPLSSTLSAADARRRRPFAHLLKVSWVLSALLGVQKWIQLEFLIL